MAATHLLVLLVGFGMMALLFLLAARGFSKKNKWLGLAAIVLAAPFFYWLGAFSEQFGSSLCYSSAIQKIANAVGATGSPKDLAKQLHSLPLRGYETVCKDVEAAVEVLPNASAP